MCIHLLSILFAYIVLLCVILHQQKNIILHPWWVTRGPTSCLSLFCKTETEVREYGEIHKANGSKGRDGFQMIKFQFTNGTATFLLENADAKACDKIFFGCFEGHTAFTRM